MAHQLDYSRRRGPSVTLLLIVILLLAAAGGVGVYIYQTPERAAEPPKPPEFHFFYGRVVDQDGNPVAGAEIQVLASELGDNAVIHGATAPILETQRQFSVWSDERGYFMVSLRGTYQELTVKDVLKPGFEWVFDWYSTTPWGAEDGNRFYRFKGPRNEMRRIVPFSRCTRSAMRRPHHVHLVAEGMAGGSMDPLNWSSRPPAPTLLGLMRRSTNASGKPRRRRRMTSRATEQGRMLATCTALPRDQSRRIPAVNRRLRCRRHPLARRAAAPGLPA